MNIPIISWLDDIIKDCFRSIYEDINERSDEYIKSLDLLKTGQQKYVRRINDTCGHVHILGMSMPLDLKQIFIRLKVNQQISSKQYLSVDKLSSGDRHYIKWIEKERKKHQTILCH